MGSSSSKGVVLQDPQPHAPRITSPPSASTNMQHASSGNIQTTANYLSPSQAQAMQNSNHPQNISAPPQNSNYPQNISAPPQNSNYPQNISAPPQNCAQVSPSPAQPVTITAEVLKRYVELEKLAFSSDRGCSQEIIAVKKEYEADLKITLQKMEQKYEEMKKKNESQQLSRQQSVQDVFSQVKYEENLSEQQEDYIDTLNEIETFGKEVQGIKSQLLGVQEEIRRITEDANSKIHLYREQDAILERIFGGTYGSEEENVLEVKYLSLVETRRTIGLTRFKWQSSRKLLEFACYQLQTAVSKWNMVSNMPGSQGQQRFNLTTEVRNNLVAAVINIRNADRYLSNISFPYCKSSELDTLTLAYTNIYTDMASAERQHHAAQCYFNTYSRSVALLQWYDQVLKDNINVEYDKVTSDLNTVFASLRAERVELIKEILKEKGLDSLSDELSSVGENTVRKSSYPSDTNIFIENDMESVCIEKVDGQGVVEDSKGMDTVISIEPLELSDLAPTPSRDELFGDIMEIKKNNDKKIEEFRRQQELDKARMGEDLQEKLRMRRMRRQHMLETTTTAN